MKRSWFVTLGLGAAVSVMALVPGFRAAAGDVCDFVTVGLDIFPVAFQAHQPSSLGDFKGHVGVAMFSATGSTTDNWTHFESDMRFMQGKLLDACGDAHRGQWGLT